MEILHPQQTDHVSSMRGFQWKLAVTPDNSRVLMVKLGHETSFAAYSTNKHSICVNLFNQEIFFQTTVAGTLLLQLSPHLQIKLLC